MSRRQKPLRPVDPVEGRVARLCASRTSRPSAVHASTRPPSATSAAPVALRAGLEHQGAGRLGLREPADLRTLGDGAGIAGGGHDDGQRHLVAPLRHDAREVALGGREQQRHQIGGEARHQHLAFGIAEAGVVLDQHRALVRQHQAGVGDAREGVPRARMPSRVGRMIRAITSASSSGVRTGAGE